ncbi:MAG: HD domain-containing protein [Aeromicrobium sp.]|nr:HD domain-containing protein [Burkholderiales bacterium]
MNVHSKPASLDEARRWIREALGSGSAKDIERVVALALELPTLTPTSEEALSAMLEAAKLLYVSGRPSQGLAVAEGAHTIAIEAASLEQAVQALSLTGICAADAGNFPRAMEAYASAMTLVKQSADAVQECKIWQNLGAALIYAGLLREAVGCFNKALMLSQHDPRAAGFAGISYANLALCYLNLDEPRAGIDAILKALEFDASPSEPHQVLNKVLKENYYTRLLIEISDFDAALSHARTAREYANKSKSPRSDIQASVAEGLAEAFSGNLDVGISRLTATLERAKTLNLASREVLVALVKALEYAGRHDEALKYLQEMLSAQRKTAEANVLHHVHQHLVQLHSADANSPLEDIKQVMRRMETRVEVVEGRVAKVEVIKQRQELFKARIEAMERLAVAAELRDDSTGEHSYRVGRMACLLAKEAGCDDETIFMIDIAARLHDVGKIGIPDGILLKPSGFNPAERAVMEMHAEIGADVLAKSEIPHIKMAEEIARHHHERWDGKGYPAKIGGREIPLAARITSLADVFDALTHKRPYKEAWTVEATLSEMLASRGQHFDPELTDLFLGLVSRLRRETRDLDHFLGEAARASPFIQARGKIWDTLKLAREEYQLQFQRSMDLQR